MESPKFLFFVSLFLIIHATAFGSPVANDRALDECIHELSVSQATLNYIKENADLPPGSNGNITCLFYCLAKKYKVVDDQGYAIEKEILASVAASYKYPELDKYMPAIPACLKKSEDNFCDRWYSIFQCLYRLRPVEPTSSRPDHTRSSRR